ncbi:pilus assembly protein TadG-related protein [Parerythrobacter aurantius]|uniref:pilus assembly protein TadG-related protein n=1 Tax=Parerythrobacter aurantius TaxID=3127706 RepID=UPI00324B7F2D
MSDHSTMRSVGPVRPDTLRRRFCRDESAAVASTYALAMFVIVGMAGVAWDWTRMTALDTELQNAADQAALAAATQLDGNANAIARATNAASNLVENKTLMGNDGPGTAITIAATNGLVFYNGYNQASDSFGTVATTDAAARVVTVTITPRQAVYSLTPVVGVFRSSSIRAQATASLGSAICNTPPVMLCNPLEDDGKRFNPANYVGKGLKLLTDNGAGVPGNFGFLANGLGTGASQLAANLGHDQVPGNCQPGGQVLTEPGQKDVVFNAINTRFDLDINGANSCPDGDANCTAPPISRKDLVKGGGNSCGYSKNGTGNSWQQASVAGRYVPPSARVLTAAERADVKIIGYPRDLCHAWSEAGNCNTIDPLLDRYGLIGTGDWDRDAFFQTNYGWDSGTWKTNTGLTASATRYQVYLWETARDASPGLSNSEAEQTDNGGKFSSAVPVCRTKGSPQRRVMTAAVINCKAEGVAGRATAKVDYWVEVFLVEPSVYREDKSSKKLTDDNQVYVEVIRAVDVGDDGNVGKVVRRDVPYLIR